MITDALLILLRVLLAPIFAALPVLTLDVFTSPVTAGARQVGYWAGFADPLLDVGLILRALALILGALVPAITTYVVANWIWRHVPSFAGFGTSGG